jgi:outer membrane protein insertion porin family
VGTGIRFTIPQFPIRLYLAKRFSFSETGQIEWQRGDVFNFNDSPTGGLDFVFAIGADFF